jgi:DNA-binding transcriptional regulator YiaG
MPSSVYWCDTSRATFQPGVDMGSVVTGLLSVQATMLSADQWVAMEVQHAPDVHGQDALAFAERRARDPQRATRLKAIRQRLAHGLEQHSQAPLGLVGLRLRAGLSQQQLAQLMETQQPSVARWEREPASMRVGTMLRLAKVLGVDEATIAVAVSAHASTVELFHG